MDRKPERPRYSSSKNYNANYISEPKIDTNDIDTTYSNFSSGEYQDIIKIIQSNKILNFRNSEGETLIHAILKNPSSSLNEANVLEIIQLLVHKNVSINAMNTYNQIPLHLAANKGYYDVIEYLVSLKSDFNKIDNYGNAPIHYLIDKFVTECKEGEYFKEGNKKIKKSLKNDKYDSITENFLILSLIEEIEEYNKKVTDDKKPTFLLNKLKQVVKDYKFYKVTDIEKLKSEKKLEIENIFKKHSSTPNDTQIKNIFNNLIKDINDKIYKDFKLENKQNKDEDNELINDNTINEINKKINTELIDNENNYSKKINEFSVKVYEIKKNIRNIEDIIFKLHRIITLVYYFKNSILNISVNNKCSNILNLFFGTEKPKFYDYDQEIETEKICNEDDIRKDKRMRFIRNYDFSKKHPKILEPMELTMDNPSGYVVQTMDNYTSIIPGTNIPINITNLAPGLPPVFNFYKLSVLFNILSYIKTQFNIVELLIRYMDVKIYGYQYFYLNYLNEIVINITNNLIVLNINYSKLEIERIVPEISKLNEEIEDQIVPTAPNKPIIDILLVQLVDTIELRKYNTTKPADRKELKELNRINFKEIVNQLQTIINKKNFFNQVNEFYKNLLKMNEINDSIISFVNKYFSLKYLEKYTQFIKNFDDTIKIENFVFNKFYTSEVKFPIDLNSYENKYFPTKNYDSNNLKKIKNDLMKKYKDYNYNILYKPFDFKFKYVKIIVDLTNYVIKFDNNSKNFDFTNYLNDLTNYETGYLNILYKDEYLNTIDKDTYFSKDDKFKNEITSKNTLRFKLIDDEFIILNEDIPLVSFENIKEIIQLIGFKIIDFINMNLTNIITRTEKKIRKEDFPNKTKEILNNTLEYIKTNQSLLKKLITEKLIIFLNSLLKIQINEEIDYLLQDMIKNDLLSSPYKELKNNELLQDLRKLYDRQLKKYTTATMLPKLLTSSGSSFLMGVKLALSELNVSTGTKIGERKLLLNKCVAVNKVDLLKEKLLHKINLRTLDRNGNTILNRLIDQYNEYAIKQIVNLDPEISTYKNNRGQNSIEYLFDVLKSINKVYTKEQIDKRIKTYETDLQMWIRSEGTFGYVELDESKKMIYNIILNCLYLFNESMWLILLKSPNGWNFQDKVKLIQLIKNKLEYTIEEKLLIKSLTDADKNILKNNSNTIILNNKINSAIGELQKEINNLENSTKQIEEEKKMGNGLLNVSNFNKLKTENDKLIKQKNTEIENLKKVLVKSTDIETTFDNLFSYINNTSLDLINDMNIDWIKYNELVKQIWSYYLPIINICNNKNNNSSVKYISYYNYSLLNLDYSNLNNEEIIVLMNYYTKIINDVYSDFYDLEKYEDSEFNYINDTILNIIYINVVNVIAIEMYSGIIGYNINKYVDNRTIKELIDNYKDPKVLKIFDIIINLLKTIVWDKLNKKNPNYPKNYNDYTFYSEELKTTIITILSLTENDDDKQFIDNIVKFYKGLVENISYNVYSEIINLLNDMKKNALLFSIYNIIKDKK